MTRTRKVSLVAHATLFFGAWSLVAMIVSTEPSCKNVQQAENGVFTAEQIVCMVIPLAEDLLTGTPEEVAAAIVAGCPSLQGFTTEVVAFVNQWIKSSPAQKDSWKTFVAANGKGARVYPVAATDANVGFDAHVEARATAH